MEVLSIDLAGPLTEMAFKLVVFFVVIAITYLIPFLILKTLFKNNEVANFISGFVLLGCLYLAFQNGIFFDWFLSFIYIG
ncbi:hypothetical protein LG275_03655 [Chryseomicrobium palamuruense]